MASNLKRNPGDGRMKGLRDQRDPNAPETRSGTTLSPTYVKLHSMISCASRWPEMSCEPRNEMVPGGRFQTVPRQIPVRPFRSSLFLALPSYLAPLPQPRPITKFNYILGFFWSLKRTIQTPHSANPRFAPFVFTGVFTCGSVMGPQKISCSTVRSIMITSVARAPGLVLLLLPTLPRMFE